LNPPPSSSLAEGRTLLLAPPPCGGARFPTLAAPVERVTGQTRATDVNVELQLLMPLDSLLNKTNASAAVIPGYGLLPGELARQILANSQGRKWWRRLFTAPALSSNNSGPIIGGDPTRRYFDGWLAKLITLRDQTLPRPVL
jgi:hypothetical protein